jgi:hypothetical protein
MSRSGAIGVSSTVPSTVVRTIDLKFIDGVVTVTNEMLIRNNVNAMLWISATVGPGALRT